MIQDNIENFKGGWFVGDFNPSIFKNPFFEVAHHKHTKGQQTFPHYHKVTNELNYIVKGELWLMVNILRKVTCGSMNQVRYLMWRTLLIMN